MERERDRGAERDSKAGLELWGERWPILAGKHVAAGTTCPRQDCRVRPRCRQTHSATTQLEAPTPGQQA